MISVDPQGDVAVRLSQRAGGGEGHGSPVLIGQLEALLAVFDLGGVQADGAALGGEAGGGALEAVQQGVAVELI